MLDKTRTNKRMVGKILEVADTEWVENLRMSRSSFFDLVPILWPYLQKQQTKMRNSIEVECQVAFFLYCLSDEGLYRKTANVFDISRTLVSTFIRKVAKIIAEHLGIDLIKLPKTLTEVEALTENFINAHDFAVLSIPSSMLIVLLSPPLGKACVIRWIIIS